MNVAIRTASPDDLADLTEVRRRASLANEGDRDLLVAHPEFLEFEGEHVAAGWTRLAALTDGHVVGFATAIPNGDFFELEDLFVDPDFMRQGIATELVRALSAMAGRHGASRIEVTANPHALGFYERVGFIAVGTADTPGGEAPRMHLDVSNE